MKILLTGATGFVGNSLIKELLKSGFQVSAVLREKVNTLPELVKQYPVGNFDKDIDFSKINVNSITVETSGNDCVDLSFGDYQLDHLYLSNCGDKGLSAGEKSNIKLNDIIVNQAKTGIAVKDSSIVTANKLSLKKTTKCLDIYRKKQEFSGGILNLNNLNCETGTIDIQAGSFTNH